LHSFNFHFFYHQIGTVIRIRLPLKKQRDTSEQLCSTSGREDVLTPRKNESAKVPNQEQCCSTNAKANIFAKELSCPVPGRTEMNSYKSKIQRKESPFTALVENWVPPSLQHERNDFDDEEWLFRPKQKDRHGSERFKAANNVSCSGSRTLWPHAHYLPEADIYALPFTGPF
jgi:hypothetical protein